VLAGKNLDHEEAVRVIQAMVYTKVGSGYQGFIKPLKLEKYSPSFPYRPIYIDYSRFINPIS
jgi:hypothetical protein